MPYVSSRTHFLSLCSCIFYALNCAIWMTNAVNFRRFEEPVFNLKHDSSVHLMRRHHKNSQLLFYKCALAKRLHSLKYLCFWLLLGCTTPRPRRPLSLSCFSFLSLSPLFSTVFFFSNSAKHNSQHSTCVPVFFAQQTEAGRKNRNNKSSIENSSCSRNGNEPKFNMCIYVKLIIQLTSTKTHSSLYYGNTMGRGAMLTKLLMWKKCK